MKDQCLILSLVASWLIHAAAVLLASAWMRSTPLPSHHDILISMIEIPPAKGQNKDATPPKPVRKAEKINRPVNEREIVELKPRATITRPEQPKEDEANRAKMNLREPISAPLSPENAGRNQEKLNGGSGGGRAGFDESLATGGVAIMPESGMAEGGDGRGAVGFGKGGGPPGLGTGERGFRQARAIQTARASYPPMALRMGLEADVTLKVFVDDRGRVTKAEIIKSAGTGFDEEAVKAVSQFRFEPAKKDGENIASEFTYIYRFRLEK